VLVVPASAGDRVICALVVEAGHSVRRWPAAVIERLQLLSDILAGAVQRGRHERTLRANVTVIEQLNARLQADNVYLKEEIKTYHDFDEIVGESSTLRLALSRLSQVAPTNSTVLLTGPTGTGKELFARALHERSRRHARPLVRVNCAALPPTLVESELFGHEKGAFTGAVATRARAASSWPTAGRSSSTRLAICRSTSRSSSCACCTKASSSGSARREPTRSTSG
jgi:transcriptional regulator with GAF, ATPase, and Fis domain